MRAWPFLLVLCACPEQVGIIAQDPSTTTGNDQGEAPTSDKDRQRPQSNELEEDEKTIEPDHPAVKSPQERALVHIHTPVDICSGILIGPKLVATAHQCFSPDLKGTYTVQEKERESYRVEVASSTLTWTIRRVTSVITPSCDWKGLDLAIVVLDDTAPSPPVSVGTAPSGRQEIARALRVEADDRGGRRSVRSALALARNDADICSRARVEDGPAHVTLAEENVHDDLAVPARDHTARSIGKRPGVATALSEAECLNGCSRAEAATKGQSVQNVIACE